MNIIIEQSVVDLHNKSKKLSFQIIKIIKKLFQKELYDDYVVFKYEGVRNDPETNDYSLTIPIDKHSIFKNIINDIFPFKLVYDDNLKNKNGSFYHDGYSYVIKIASSGAVYQYKINKDQKALFKMFETTRSTFAHELVHLIDVADNKKDYKSDQSKMSRDEYFLSNAEKKAFQSQGLDYVINEINDGLSIILKHRPDSSVHEIRSIMDFNKKRMWGDFYGAVQSLSRQVGAKAISDEYKEELKGVFDEFYKRYSPIINKNIKGILDGSIKSKNDFIGLKL